MLTFRLFFILYLDTKVERVSSVFIYQTFMALLEDADE